MRRCFPLSRPQFTALRTSLQHPHRQPAKIRRRRVGLPQDGRRVRLAQVLLSQRLNRKLRHHPPPKFRSFGPEPHDKARFRGQRL